MRNVLLFSLLTVSGCGLMSPVPKKMYDGERRPLSEVSILGYGMDQPKNGISIRVVKVGGEPLVPHLLGMEFQEFQGPPRSSIHIAPGTHTVTLQGSRSGGYRQPQRMDVELVAAPGHSYVPRFEYAYDGSGFRFWIEDKGPGYPERCLSPESYSKMYVENVAVEGC